MSMMAANDNNNNSTKVVPVIDSATATITDSDDVMVSTNISKRKRVIGRFIYGVMILALISCFTLLMDRKMIDLTKSLNDMFSSMKDTMNSMTITTATDTSQEKTAIRRDEQQPQPQTQPEQRTTDDATKKKQGPINIVLFYADDWSYSMVGASGNQYIKTPHLDQIAREGILFSHNCVVTSVCMQSRATLYTGQYSSRHLTYYSWRNVVMYEPERWRNTLHYTMTQNTSYHVGFFGKYHHVEPAPTGTFHKFRSAPYSHYFARNNIEKHVTQWNEEDGIEFLKERPMDQPFFMTISFFATHAEDGNIAQYRPMNSSMSLYNESDVPLPKTYTQEHWEELPAFFSEDNVGRARYRLRYLTPEMYQHHMKNTCRMVTEVDTAIGNMIKILKEQGVYDNTMIIFTTDNGNFHGQHGLAEKWYPYEESLRVPLIIKDPRMAPELAGTTNAEFTLNIDLAPTILSAAGLTPPSVMQGRNIATLYLPDIYPKANDEWRKSFIYEFHDDNGYIRNSLAYVTKDFKYIIWDEYNYTQLFHLPTDPLEEYDLLLPFHPNHELNPHRTRIPTDSKFYTDEIHRIVSEYSKKLLDLQQLIPHDGTF